MFEFKRLFDFYYGCSYKAIPFEWRLLLKWFEVSVAGREERRRVQQRIYRENGEAVQKTKTQWLDIYKMTMKCNEMIKKVMKIEFAWQYEIQPIWWSIWYYWRTFDVDLT